jgi:VCBS repeat-containing protein
MNDSNTTPANTPVGGTVKPNDIGVGLTFNFPTTTIQGGTVVGNPSNGDYTYTPPNNFSGFDSFIYTNTDSNNSISNQATVTIDVTPVALPDTGITPANQSLINQNTISNDQGTSLSIFSYVTPTTKGGVVSMNTNGTYTYMPPYLVNGTKFSGSGPNADTFDYTAIDSAGQKTTTTVTITVTPVAFDQTVFTNFDTPLNGPSVLDPDIGTGISVTSNTQPSHGTVTINPDGTYLYTPNSGYTGPDQFTYTITDSSGQTATANVFITVGSTGPTSFTGKIKKGHLVNGTCYSLNAQWTASPSSNIAFYSIFNQNGKLVAKVTPNQPLTFTTCLAAKKDAFGYTIVSTDTNGNTSPPLPITIVP